MRLSVVASLYRSAHHLEEFYLRTKQVAQQFSDQSFEIILVNDGSPDNSLSLAVKIAEKDPHVTVIDLSRNFGHHKAMMTGLAAARGDLVFLIDSDLEEEPEWLQSFFQQMEAEQSDVVHGIQLKRKGRFLEQMTGAIFYRLFRLFTGIEQPNNITTARLMSRRYTEALLLHQEREINIGGLWIITGFKQCYQLVHKHASSPTTYSFSGKVSHLVNAVTSFSSLPLVFTFYTGLFTSFSALIYISYLVIRYLFIAAPPDGYTSIIASIWLFSGLTIFFMGIQGIYIAKIFSEVKQRPYTIIRHIYRYSKKTDEQK